MLPTRIVGLLLALGSVTPALVSAEEPPPKAVIALLGSAERFNIGQDGFCGNRTEIDRPSNAQFKIPSQTKTYFFVKASVAVEIGTYYCEGDYSFTPAAGKLHIIRFLMEGGRCKVDVFSSLPGETPQPLPVQRELRRSCLLQ